MSEQVEYLSYFQIVFPNLTERRKLDLIKYNKNLQNSFKINIINYEIISHKYKIGERNGKGEEYDNKGNLIFEGEYLNGKRNGGGKEYDDKGNLIFEGRYKNGKRNGKGKEYDNVGNLKFEVDYKNGKKWLGKDMMKKEI